MKLDFSAPLFFVKIFVLIFSGVYCLAPLGMIVVYGITDFLMPIEAVVGVLVSVACWVWGGVLTWRIARS